MAHDTRDATENSSDDPATDSIEGAQRFGPEQEAALLEESNAARAEGGRFFGAGAFSEAIGSYDRALAACPPYLEYEVAVLKSNVAACHIKLEEWDEAAAAATAAISGLDRLVPEWKTAREKREDKSDGAEGQERGEDDARVKEVADDEAVKSNEEVVAAPQLTPERRLQATTLRAKSLMRRARANTARGGWANLAAAEADFKETLQLGVIPSADRKLVQGQLAALGPRIGVAKEQEMAEMMGKLKELGNGILKPFGLSTDMFKFQKDEKTGGYNMNFGQGDGQG